MLFHLLSKPQKDMIGLSFLVFSLQVKASFMSLRQSVCPTRLTNVDRKKYVFFEDFETTASGSRTAEVPAFCGSYSRFWPGWFNFPAIVDLSRYPHVSGNKFLINIIGERTIKGSFIHPVRTIGTKLENKACHRGNSGIAFLLRSGLRETCNELTKRQSRYSLTEPIAIQI